ncbi:hypothetical protein HPB48_009861 [Haemaphysalis longicornis]|uniref:Uncharacterized protein n=1 Tax=Haemaphysalis longicornis TaxID=44386 RepID=A0A9J6GJU2_HAELO|nr:hypothetical protein HPB48_009861 [Haemaphysalis longicornis]
MAPEFFSNSACPNYNVYDSEDDTDDYDEESVGSDEESIESMDLDVDDQSFAITESSVYVKHGPLVCTVSLYSVIARTNMRFFCSHEEQLSGDTISEAKYIVFESCLLELLKRCMICQQDCTLSLTTSGTLLRLWEKEQEQLLSDGSAQPLSLSGDGRCDSPGFCAKYLTYTLTDAKRDVILHTELVQRTLDVCTEHKTYKEAPDASGGPSVPPPCVAAEKARPSKEDVVKQQAHRSRFKK